MESALFSSRTVLSDLSVIFIPSAGNASGAPGRTRLASELGAADRQTNSSALGQPLDDASPVQPEVSRIWSLLFSKTEPPPIAPLSMKPLITGRLTYFEASHFELTYAGDASTGSAAVGEGAYYLVERRKLSAVHGALVVAVKTPKLRGSALSKHTVPLILRELQVLTHSPL